MFSPGTAGLHYIKKEEEEIGLITNNNETYKILVISVYNNPGTYVFYLGFKNLYENCLHFNNTTFAYLYGFIPLKIFILILYFIFNV